MSLPYFFIPDEINGKTISLPQDTARHVVQVLRMKAGEKLMLTNGNGNLCTAVIIETAKKNCTVAIEESAFKERNTRKVSIALSPLKNASRFEWFVEKATEIGVYQVIPLICHRTERQHFKQARIKNILVSAMLQSRQTWLPELSQPRSFESVVIQSLWQQRLIAHCEELQKSTLSNYSNTDEIQILIGPEGDFTIKEIELAIRYGYEQVSLGNTRLRTETAALVAAAWLVNNS